MQSFRVLGRSLVAVYRSSGSIDGAARSPKNSVFYALEFDIANRWIRQYWRESSLLQPVWLSIRWLLPSDSGSASRSIADTQHLHRKTADFGGMATDMSEGMHHGFRRFVR